MREELQQVRLLLEERIGRPSRWSGNLLLTSDPDIRGAKPFRCDIVLHESLTGQEVRWRTIIHELLHTFSAGYNRRDYDIAPGWEEGVVEQTQRLLRPALLTRLVVTVDETVFEQVEASHRYNGYLQALETLRKPLNIPPRVFYLGLLSEPIHNRGNSILRRGMAMPSVQRAAFVMLYSVSNAVLREKV